jgi:hypothetical protein
VKQFTKPFRGKHSHAAGSAVPGSCGKVCFSGCWRYVHVEGEGPGVGVVVAGVAFQGERDGGHAVALGVLGRRWRRPAGSPGRKCSGDRRLGHAGRPVPVAAAGRRRAGLHPGRAPAHPGIFSGWPSISSARNLASRAALVSSPFRSRRTAKVTSSSLEGPPGAARAGRACSISCLARAERDRDVLQHQGVPPGGGLGAVGRQHPLPARGVAQHERARYCDYPVTIRGCPRSCRTRTRRGGIGCQAGAYGSIA